MSDTSKVNRIYDFSKIYKLPDIAKLYKENRSNESAPIHVRIEVSEICNLKCNFCVFHDPERKSKVIDTADLQSRVMDISRALILAEEMKKAGVRVVSFTGAGDPLVYPSIEKLIRRFNELGIGVGITSNFAMEIPDTLIEALTKCDWVRWSQNAGTDAGFMEIHNPRNKNSTFARAKNNIKRMVSSGKNYRSDFKLNSSFVLNAISTPDIEPAIKTAIELGVSSIQFRPDILLERGASSGSYTQSQLAIFKRCELQYAGQVDIDWNFNRQSESELIFDKDLVCVYSNSSTYISVNFDVYPCCYTRPVNKEYVIGNVSKIPFDIFWGSDVRKNFYKNLFVKNCPSCPHVEENKSLIKMKSIEVNYNLSGNKSDDFYV